MHDGERIAFLDAGPEEALWGYLQDDAGKARPEVRDAVGIDLDRPRRVDQFGKGPAFARDHFDPSGSAALVVEFDPPLFAVLGMLGVLLLRTAGSAKLRADTESGDDHGGDEIELHTILR
ncbi:MAG: hypothetical protein HYY16_06360 [Planctomycetes bacterium]|nr:hypothetical protein [Planctomycetota bacterium]